jgi:hypothetical protein
MFLPRVGPFLLPWEMCPVEEGTCGSVFIIIIIQLLGAMDCNCLHHRAERVRAGNQGNLMVPERVLNTMPLFLADGKKA